MTMISCQNGHKVLCFVLDLHGNSQEESGGDRLYEV
jgi:hypothetical protein